MLSDIKKTSLSKRTYSKDDFYDMFDKKTRDDYFKNQKFKKYYENSTQNILRKTKVLTEKSKVEGLTGGPGFKETYDNSSFIQTTDLDDLRYLHVKERILEVSSRFRDKTLYPNPNSYVVQESISSVISAEIIQSTFTNTLLLIKSSPINLANNKIYWQNQSDIYDGEPYTYVATIPDGNYNDVQLSSIIEEQMNSVQRITSSLFHDINVDINTTTDTTTFESFESTVLTNPFSITSIVPGESFTDIEVEYIGWTTVLNIGDLITIENSSAVDGIGATFMNTDHVIREKISDDIFIIRVNVVATSTVTNQGGNVVLKRRISWRLLWGSKNETLATVLGFPEVDTNYNQIHLNSEETFNIFDTSNNGIRLKINKVSDSDISTELTTVFTTTNHGLNDGDLIYINYDDTIDIVYDHFQDEVVLSPTEEEDLQRFLSSLYNPSGLYISNVTDTSFTVGVPYLTIASIESYITSSVLDSDENGSVILKTFNTSIQLNGDSRIYICCPELGRLVESDSDYLTNNTNKNLDDIFTPVDLTGGGLSTSFNSFVPVKKIFNKNVININELHFSFKTEDGNLVDFNETEHRFMIKFLVIEQKFKDQDFSTKNNFFT